MIIPRRKIPNTRVETRETRACGIIRFLFTRVLYLTTLLCSSSVSETESDDCGVFRSYGDWRGIQRIASNFQRSEECGAGGLAGGVSLRQGGGGGATPTEIQRKARWVMRRSCELWLNRREAVQQTITFINITQHPLRTGM